MLEDPDMERIPEAFVDAIHDAVNAVQVAVLLAAEIDRGARHSRGIRRRFAEQLTERRRRSRR
jgi:hypothetical protein